MLLDLPDDILRKIFLDLDCYCINHHYSSLLANKQMYEKLNKAWFYKNIIYSFEDQKNIYFYKYRKYCVKYNHLKHQVEEIWTNQSDDSDSSISSMDILDYFLLGED